MKLTLNDRIKALIVRDGHNITLGTYPFFFGLCESAACKSLTKPAAQVNGCWWAPHRVWWRRRPYILWRSSRRGWRPHMASTKASLMSLARSGGGRAGWRFTGLPCLTGLCKHKRSWHNPKHNAGVSAHASSASYPMLVKACTTMLGSMPASLTFSTAAGLDIAAFELMKERLVGYYGGLPPPPLLLACGMLSSSGAQVFVYPFGLARTRMQVSLF